MPNTPFRRAYDHRIRERICESQDTRLFPELSIPRSTAASWVRRGRRSVVTSDIPMRGGVELERELIRLRKQTRVLHQWLYLHHLDSVATVRRLVRYYVEQHNTVMPHAAFQGQTPDEMYFNGGDDIVAEVRLRRGDAMAERLQRDREKSCGRCDETIQEPTVRRPETRADPAMSQMHT
jgi:hypothetical protein